MLENMGFRIVDEHTYHVTTDRRRRRRLLAARHDAGARRRTGGRYNALKTRLETAFVMVMQGIAENDGYNALVLMRD